jgi:hypothetical protein
MSDSESDPDYVDLEENESTKSKGQGTGPKNTLLQRLWPSIKKLALQGKQPQEIADTLNKDLSGKDQVDNKQISGKIRREKEKGNIKLSVNSSGSVLASNEDCMLFSTLNYNSSHIIALESKGKWARLATSWAGQHDRRESRDDDSDDGRDRRSDENKEAYRCARLLRFRTHATKTHYFLAGEACVDRAWSSKVNDEDDEMIDVAVVLKPPDFEVIASLFPTHHVDFGWEEDVEETVRFSLHAGAKLVRQRPVTSCAPSNDTPLWYGFQYEFQEMLDQTPAPNRDFSKLLINKVLAATIDDSSSAHSAATSPQQPPSSSQSTSVSTTNNTAQGENEKKRKRDEEERKERESRQKQQ